MICRLASRSGRVLSKWTFGLGSRWRIVCNSSCYVITDIGKYVRVVGFSHYKTLASQLCFSSLREMSLIHVPRLLAFVCAFRFGQENLLVRWNGVWFDRTRKSEITNRP